MSDLAPMYPGMADSPETFITNKLSETDTIITVQSVSDLLPDIPCLLTLDGGLSHTETVLVTGVSGNSLTAERGYQGVAREWPEGTAAACRFTEAQYRILIENIKILNAAKVENSQLTTALVPIKTDLAQKQPIPPHAPGVTFGLSGTNPGATVALVGVEERAVVIVARPATFIEIRPGVSKILNWDDSDVVVWEHNGAQVHYYKENSQHELYAMGNGFVLYKFTFDDVEHTVTVEDCGVLPIERGGTGADNIHRSPLFPALQSGWTNSIHPNMEVQYSKTFDNIVFITGAVQHPTGGAGNYAANVVAVLPAEYRPARLSQVSMNWGGAANPNAGVCLVMEASSPVAGQIRVHMTRPHIPNEQIHLGCCFRVD